MTKTTVLITDKKHELCGKEVKGSLIYYDINHTGSSPDLFTAEHEGCSFRLLSTQIDAEHYNNQLANSEIERLGANVGDLVEITRTGSGSFCRDWNQAGEHLITKISSHGQVEFDHGKASCFRPDVIVIKRADA